MLGPSNGPATLKPAVPEIIHPIQHATAPQRLLLPHSDTEILTHLNDDISSIRDGYTGWVMSDATTTRERHMACKGSAVPAFRKPTREGIHLTSKITVSTPVCQIVCWRSAFQTGIPETDVVNQVPLRNTSQENCTSLHYKKRLSICSTSAS